HCQLSTFPTRRSSDLIEVNASPILAAETLRRNLWNVAYGALVTSATLTALGTFDRYRMRAGLPKTAVTAVVPSPFMHADAGVLRSEEHTSELQSRENL